MHHHVQSGPAARHLAERILATVKLSLPESAGDVRVDDTPLDPFRDAAVVTFEADTAEVLHECEQAGITITPGGGLAPQDKTVLRGHRMPSGGTLGELYLNYGRGPNLLLVMPASGTGEVAVAVYTMPSR